APAGHDGARPADRAGSDPDPVPLPGLRHEPGRGRAGAGPRAAERGGAGGGAGRAGRRLMRLLHTSDWHLGRTTHGRSRAPDHDHAIEEIVDAAREARPHLVLHTGDLFDAPRPGYEEMTRGIDALRRLAELAPVLVLCGNH